MSLRVKGQLGSQDLLGRHFEEQVVEPLARRQVGVGGGVVRESDLRVGCSGAHQSASSSLSRRATRPVSGRGAFRNSSPATLATESAWRSRKALIRAQRPG